MTDMRFEAYSQKLHAIAKRQIPVTRALARRVLSSSVAMSAFQGIVPADLKLYCCAQNSLCPARGSSALTRRVIRA